MSRVIDAIFRLKDEFTAPMKNCITALTDVGREGRRARKQIDNAGKAISGMGQTMTASLTTPILGLGAASYSTFENVNKNLNLVQATMGEAKFATADLSAALKDAAVNSIFSMEEASGALVNFARQGFDAAEAADMLTPAMNLAAGTATDLDSVTSGLGNTLKAFGASADEATHYADMFAQAQAQANTDVQGLFDAMSVAGPIAQTVGWQFQDIGALIGVFGDASIGATEGATALKTGLARLASPAKAGAQAMEELGMDVSTLFDENGALRSMPEVIGALQDSFSGLTQEQQLSAASAIFGKNQISNWLALINGPGREALQGMSDDIAAASGNAQAAADAMVTPTERLKSTFDVFKATVGELLADNVVPLINRATELIDVFRQMDPVQQEQIMRFAGIAAAAGPMIFTFGKAVSGVSSLAGAFANVFHAGGLLKAGFAAMASPAGIVIGALAGIAVIAGVLFTHMDELRSTFAAFQAEHGPQLAEIKAAWEDLMATLGPIGDWLANTFVTSIIEGFKAFTQSGGVTVILEGIKDQINGIKEVASGLSTFISGVFAGDWETAWEGIKESFVGIADIIVGKFETITGFIQSIGEGIGGMAKSAKEGLANLNPFKGDKDVPGHASGTNYWRGGFTRVGESGGEIINLPSGTQIIPHDASKNTPVGGGVTVAKLADTIVVREDADIDRITDALVRKLRDAQDNMGGVQPA